jgi:hypothetical protein
MQTGEEVITMSTPSIATPAVGLRVRQAEEAERYAGIKQYSLGQIFAVWAAAALPMGILAWIVAPAIKDGFGGTGDVPLIKALLLLLTGGMIWEFVLVMGLVWFEQRSLRWSTLRDALWLRSPQSPRSGRVGGRLWLILIPLIALFAVGGCIGESRPRHVSRLPRGSQLLQRELGLVRPHPRDVRLQHPAR